MTQIPGPKIRVCVCVCESGVGGVLETWPEQLWRVCVCVYCSGNLVGAVVCVCRVVETWPEQLCFLKVAFIVTVAAVGTEGPSWGTVRKDAGGESAAAPGRAGSLVCICASLPCDIIPVHSPCW